MPEAADAARGEVTRVLAAWRGGDRAAADRLFELLYEELRRVAHRALADQSHEATLQTTALVHELYLRLAGSFRPGDDDRRRFFGVAAKAMRRILIDRARERLTEKRGGGVRPLPLDIADIADTANGSRTHEAAEAISVDGALTALERHDPRLAELVELRFFAGFSVEECAGLLDRSETTVKRDWQKARALLAGWLATDS
ncbi:MAG: ECF-type sigma factor [Thermoanaerobaculia bacterium]